MAIKWDLGERGSGEEYGSGNYVTLCLQGGRAAAGMCCMLLGMIRACLDSRRSLLYCTAQ